MKTLTYSLIVILGMALLAVQGCATKRQTGTVAGGAAGAAVGAAVDEGEGALIGGLLGALVGSEIGARMDADDRRQTAMALENNRVGQTSTWTDPDTGARYGVTPTETYSQDGSPCRRFVIEREIAGDEYRSTETACRQADGSWRIIT